MFRIRAAYAPALVARSVVQTGSADLACCAGHARNDNAATIGWAPDPNTYDLHHANASRYGARKELLLLEDHLAHEKCPECTYKHLDRAIAFLDEARTLDEGDERDTALSARLSALSPTIGDEAREIRAIRREIGIMLGRGKNANDAADVSGVEVGEESLLPSSRAWFLIPAAFVIGGVYLLTR